MYCPSCGAELAQELSYCNRCGANLKSTLVQSGVPPAKLVGATWAISIAIVLVTLGGLGMIFGLVMALITRGINLSSGGMLLIFFSLFVVLGIVWLLARQLSRVLELPRLSGDANKPTLDQKPAQQIPAPHQPLSSVTEHTTRTFDAIPRGPETQR